jgi:hypothetical protein
MQNKFIFYGMLLFILGGLLGSWITYEQVHCKTSGINIQLGGTPNNGAGISITKTGNTKNNEKW